MESTLEHHFNAELKIAKEAIKENNSDRAWYYLSRAHILGQFYTIPHLKTHYWMFILSVKTFNIKEIKGQITRLILAAPGSLLNKAPSGNTGLSNVGIFKPMPIPDDLQNILDESKNKIN